MFMRRTDFLIHQNNSKNIYNATPQIKKIPANNTVLIEHLKRIWDSQSSDALGFWIDNDAYYTDGKQLEVFLSSKQKVPLNFNLRAFPVGCQSALQLDQCPSRSVDVRRGR